MIRSDLPTGRVPRSVALADLNADGHLDIVVANSASNTVSVYLGDGTGGFQPPADFATGSMPDWVAIGDVNGDGKPDLAVANAASNTVSVLRGDGFGGFPYRSDFASGAGPRIATLADVDGDEDLDLIVANLNANTVSILLGDGAGGFGTKSDFPTGRMPYSVAVGDVDRDGHPDLAVAGWGTETVSILRGDGAGGYAARSDITSGKAPYSVALGRMDADTLLDLVVVNSGDNTLAVLRGDGGGGFTASAAPRKLLEPRCVALADLNRDGTLDVAVTELQSGSVSALMGDGAGGFGLGLGFPTAEWPRAVALGDLDEDGFPDLAVTCSGSDTLTIFMGGISTATRTSLASSQNPARVGAPVTLTATVLPFIADRPQPTGNVAFYDGALKLGVATLQDSTAVFQTSFGRGLHALAAVYEGSASYEPSTSEAVGLQVEGDLLQTSVTLTSGVNPCPVGVNLTFGATVHATVPPGLAAPSGTVTFRDGSDTLATVAVAGSRALLTLSDLPVGSHPLVAIYSGDSTYAPATSNMVSQRIVQRTTTTLTSSPNPSLYRMPFVLSATVAPVAPGEVTPAGMVNFQEGATPLGGVGLVAGVANLTISSRMPGTYSFTATYTGDSLSLSSASLVITQRVTAGPVIVSVRDVPGDQGREVRLVVAPSPMDTADSPHPIVRYEVFRRIEDALAGGAAAAYRRAAPVTVQIAGWDAVGSMGAYADTVYNIVVPTLMDSNATGPHDATFFARAATAEPSLYYDSEPDSGHSIDNLPPAAPAAFSATWADGATSLRWRGNGEPDIGGYRLHRGESAGFLPDIASLIASTPDTVYVDPGPPGRFYKLVAVDVNGNESPCASLGAAAGGPLEFALLGARPNPASTARIAVEFTLAAAAPARLELLDVSGRLVSAREVGPLGPGRHVVDLGGGVRLAPGIYLARLVQGARTSTVRLAALR